MQAPTYDARKGTYASMWARMEVLPTRKAAVNLIANRILLNKARYVAVAKSLGLPEVAWAFIGCTHYRESNLNFHGHLHNGDPLTARTRHVPAGRPLAPAKPPFTWEESAIDALRMRGVDKITHWSVEMDAYEEEGYNGWGYFWRGKTSSYLWAWTNDHDAGKYVADGAYDPAARDAQCGVMPILKAIMDTDKTVTFDPPRPLPAPVATAPPVKPIHPAWGRFVTKWAKAIVGVATVVCAFIFTTHCGL